MNGSFITIIMAAGLGKRMKSDLPKVLHKLNDRPLVHYVIETARNVGAERILLVIGHKGELVIESTADMDVEWVLQEKQLGTGDAVRVCEDALEGFTGNVLILSGDVPLLKPTTIERAWKLHVQRNAAVTVFTFKPNDPAGYGRIVRGDANELLRIVEHKDADSNEIKIGEVNAGIYFYNKDLLFAALKEIDNNNASGEYYLTDTISLLGAKHKPMAAFLVEDPMEVAGINTAEQLSMLDKKLKVISGIKY